MKKRILFIILGLISVCYAQTGRQVNYSTYVPFSNIPDNHRKEANKILEEMLDGVGLYVILGDIRPMSMVDLSIYRENKYFNKDTLSTIKNQKQFIDKIELYSKILNEMSDGVFYFQFLSSYQVSASGNADTIIYMPQILILRKDLTRKKICEKASFFNSFGIDTSSDFVEKIKSKLFNIWDAENSSFNKYSARAFGYLYGFPDYAVDFFENAQADGNLTEGIGKDRKNVEIPVFSEGVDYQAGGRHFSSEGVNRFVYIVPMKDSLNGEDNKLIHDAQIILEKYKQKRSKYINQYGFDAISMIQDWYKEDAKKFNK